MCQASIIFVQHMLLPKKQKKKTLTLLGFSSRKKYQCMLKSTVFHLYFSLPYNTEIFYCFNECNLLVLYPMIEFSTYLLFLVFYIWEQWGIKYIFLLSTFENHRQELLKHPFRSMNDHSFLKVEKWNYWNINCISVCHFSNVFFENYEVATIPAAKKRRKKINGADWV